MSVQFQIEETPDYLSIRVTGEGTADEVWRQYDSIAEHCNRANVDAEAGTNMKPGSRPAILLHAQNISRR